MRNFLLCVLSIGLGTALFLSNRLETEAADYRVEFSKNGTGGQTVSLASGEITNWHPWHTINDPQGVNIFNGSGAQIKAVWIKVNDSTADHFAVAFDAGHDLFPTVWKKNDNSEVLFLDGDNFMSMDTIWNRVNDTSGATGTTGNIFTGRLYTENPPVPQGWVQVSRTPPVHHEAVARAPWTEIVQNLPMRFRRRITTYTTDENESTLVLLSRNIPFAYNVASKELRPVLIQVPYKNGANRLTLKKNVLELWKDGELVGKSDLSQEVSVGPRLTRQ
jgi:hypothetical protein